MVRKIGKYELGKTIGEGAYSKVKLGIDTETGERVAIKILEQTQLEAQKMMEKVRREIRILKGINHLNVVRLIEVMVSKTHLYIVLELVAGGELFSKLAADLKFEEPVARYYFKQLIAGVSYCHARGVCHRDLKPENLLLTENNVLKISDFGLSALMTTDTGDKKMLSTQCGTPQYVSPEVLADNPLYEGPPVDVWSCGVILFVCLTGDLPFSDRDTEILFKKIKTAEVKPPKFLSPEAIDLIQKILQPDPAKRITIDQIKQHPWFLLPTPTDFPVQATSALQRQPSRMHAMLRDTQDDIREVEEVDDNDKFTAYRGQTITNAFELISMAGSMDLTRLLTRGDRTQVMRRMASARFVTKSTPSEVFHRLKLFFESIPQVGLKPLEPMMKLKVNARTPGGLVVVHIHILVLLPGTKEEAGLQLVDFRRAGGDILAFNRLFRDAQAALGSLILQQTQGAKLVGAVDSPTPFLKPLLKQESINRARSTTDRDGAIKKEKEKKKGGSHTEEQDGRGRAGTLGTSTKEKKEKDKDSDGLRNSIRRLLHSSSSKAIHTSADELPPPVSPKKPSNN